MCPFWPKSWHCVSVLIFTISRGRSLVAWLQKTILTSIRIVFRSHLEKSSEDVIFMSELLKRKHFGRKTWQKKVLTLALLDFKWSPKYPFSSLPGRDLGISCESWSNLLAEAATSHGTSIQVNKRAFMLSKQCDADTPARLKAWV